jgi:hypothetical protein
LTVRLRKQQQEALFQRLQVLVRDASHLGISAEVLNDRFAAAIAQFYQQQQDEQLRQEYEQRS